MESTSEKRLDNPKCGRVFQMSIRHIIINIPKDMRLDFLLTQLPSSSRQD